MRSDVRILNRERMLREKDSVKLQNRQIRRELKCFLERKKESIPSENSAQEKNELIKKVSAPGFVRSRVGLLVSAVLAAELFAGCGSAFIEQNADADAAADVQPNEVRMQEDAETPDVDLYEGSEDVGPDEVRTQEDAETPDVEEGGPEVQDEGRVEDVQEIEEDGGSQEDIENAEEVQESDVDSSEDVGPDEVEIQEDAETPDVEDEESEDVQEIEEDGDSQESMEDAEEVQESDVDSSEDVGPDEAEADGPVCEPIIYTETRPPEPAGMICGNAREKIVTVQVTEYGEGCPRPGRETSLESVEYRISPPLDYAGGELDPLGGLVCARGNETELLNPGTYMIIQLSPSEMQAGYKLASRLNMRPGPPPLNGGTYQLELMDVSGSLTIALNTLLDAAGAYIDDILVPGQRGGGFAVIDPNNGAFAWDLRNMPVSASQAIIRLEGGNAVVIGNSRTLRYEVPGDEGLFETRILAGSSDSEIAGYGFYRIRT